MNNIYLKIHLDDTENNTSSQPEMFYKNRCSEKFRKIHRKSFEPCLRSSTLLKKRGLWHRFFLVNFSKFLRTPVFIEHLRVAASGIIRILNIFLIKRFCFM